MEKGFIDDGVVEIYTASVEGKVMNRTIEIESVLGEFSREIAKALGMSEDEVAYERRIILYLDAVGKSRTASCARGAAPETSDQTVAGGTESKVDSVRLDVPTWKATERRNVTVAHKRMGESSIGVGCGCQGER